MTEFYKNYCKLCDERGLTPSGAAIKMGLNKGTVSAWKNKGVIPAGKTLQTLSAFFCVSTERLLPGEQKPPSASAEGATRDSIAGLIKHLSDEDAQRALGVLRAMFEDTARNPSK